MGLVLHHNDNVPKEIFRHMGDFYFPSGFFGKDLKLFLVMPYSYCTSRRIFNARFIFVTVKALSKLLIRDVANEKFFYIGKFLRTVRSKS